MKLEKSLLVEGVNADDDEGVHDQKIDLVVTTFEVNGPYVALGLTCPEVAVTYPAFDMASHYVYGSLYLHLGTFQTDQNRDHDQTYLYQEFGDLCHTWVNDEDYVDADYEIEGEWTYLVHHKIYEVVVGQRKPDFDPDFLT